MTKRENDIDYGTTVQDSANGEILVRFFSARIGKDTIEEIGRPHQRVSLYEEENVVRSPENEVTMCGIVERKMRNFAGHGGGKRRTEFTVM